jgi:outer membrane biogenesis lipoprotein LolB
MKKVFILALSASLLLAACGDPAPQPTNPQQPPEKERPFHDPNDHR